MRSILFHHFDSLASTQERAKELLDSFDREVMTVVIAKTQTQGRGRQGRSFLSPEGGLYMTAVFRLEGELQKLISLSLIVGLAIARQSSAFRVKWPNDILVDGKKAGSILIEQRAGWWLVGIGLNLTTPSSKLEGIDQPVTTLQNEGITLPNAAETILKELESMLELFLERGFAPFREEYLARSAYKVGDGIRVRLGKEKEPAQYIGVSELGELEIEIGGKRKLASFGEILF